MSKIHKTFFGQIPEMPWHKEKNTTKEYFCPNCYAVFQGGKGKCCNIYAEEFDPNKHVEYLISNSNAWIKVHKRWKGHPLLQEVSEELWQDGIYGAATIFNEFVRRLLESEQSEHRRPYT